MPLTLIMLDGLRPDAITPETTPNLRRLMARGAYTLDGRSVVPPVTLPCHTSIFHSVPPARHGVQSNDWRPMARPVRGLVEQLAEHGKKSGMIHNWEQLRDLNRVGTLHFSLFSNTGFELDGDTWIAEAAVEQFAGMARGELDFLFVYFGSIDLSGHVYGWMSDGYLAQARFVDRLAGQVIDAMPPEMTVIAHADHGGHERNHGDDGPEDMTIPWIMAGPGVRADHKLTVPVSLESKTFDLMILDLQMPLVDGATVLRTLRADGKHPSMTVIVATAYPHRTDTEIERLADYVLQKPINYRDFVMLARRLRETLLAANC